MEGSPTAETEPERELGDESGDEAAAESSGEPGGEAGGERGEEAGGPRPPREFPKALLTLMVIGVVLVVFVVLVVVRLAGPSTTNGRSPLPLVPRSVLNALYTIPRPAFDAAGAPSQPAVSLPTVLQGQAALSASGRPTLVWVGAEFCATCAAERWAVVVALARFGTFSGLAETWSATNAPFSHLPTFSLDGATYHSLFVSLDAVEEYGSVLSERAPAGYPVIDRPNAAVLHLEQRYLPAGSAATAHVLPFVDVANRLIVVGTTLSPSLLEQSTVPEVASDLTQSSTCSAGGESPAACSLDEAILGSANEIDAGLCAAGATDAKVCSSAAVREAERLLGISA